MFRQICCCKATFYHLSQFCNSDMHTKWLVFTLRIALVQFIKTLSCENAWFCRLQVSDKNRKEQIQLILAICREKYHSQNTEKTQKAGFVDNTQGTRLRHKRMTQKNKQKVTTPNRLNSKLLNMILGRWRFVHVDSRYLRP